MPTATRNRFLDRARAQRDTIQTQLDQLVDGAGARIDQERAAYRSANPGATDDAVAAAVSDELTADESTRMAELLEQRSPLDDRVSSLVALEREAEASEPGSIVQVRSEPLTYERESRNSYLRDLANANAPGEAGSRDPAITDRLQRHAVEMRTIAETRADMTRTDGAGGEFVPPLWLVDQYLPLARAGRVFADLCRGMPLPAARTPSTSRRWRRAPPPPRSPTSARRRTRR
jgi:hypothetical protein